MGSNTEKNLQNSYKNLSKKINTDNFCYRKVGRARTKCEAIEKITIFKRVTKIIPHFDGGNNIFAECTICLLTYFN